MLLLSLLFAHSKPFHPVWVDTLNNAIQRFWWLPCYDRRTAQNVVSVIKVTKGTSCRGDSSVRMRWEFFLLVPDLTVHVTTFPLLRWVYTKEMSFDFSHSPCCYFIKPNLILYEKTHNDSLECLTSVYFFNSSTLHSSTYFKNECSIAFVPFCLTIS